jgi:transcriptional regulator with XRE-family HTH domain
LNQRTHPMSGTGSLNSIQERALSLLGVGIQSEQVAAALGVKASYISQLLSDESFAREVAERRFTALSKHNERDASYDSLEDLLIRKLESKIPLLFKPLDVVKALQAVNAAKRRGQSAPEQVTNQQSIVQVLMPTQIVNKFTTNVHNQVVKAGDQDLFTIPSGQLLQQTEQQLEEKQLDSESLKDLLLESLGG